MRVPSETGKTEPLIDTALIMAGGSGQRMRSSGLPIAKPLIPALGVPLLERNVHALLRAEVRRIIVAVPADLPEVATLVQGRLHALGRAAGAEVVCCIEKTPLGNIGCAGQFRDETHALLVVYADNLTTLDLRMIAAEHRDSRADMTITTHKQPFRMPFGEVRVEDGEVREYIEKPTHSYDVCSAVSVLGPTALAALPTDRATGLSELVRVLIGAGQRVRAVPHDAPWIDVNEAGSIPLAEKLIRANQKAFDLWITGPYEERTLRCEMADNRVRLSPPQQSSCWWTLTEVQGAVSEPVMVLDHFEEEQSRIRRYFVERRLGMEPQGEGVYWWQVPEALADQRVSPLAKRVLSFACQAQEGA